MAIRLTESQLRRIVREEARRLLEGADPEIERAEAYMQKNFPLFFKTRGVIMRGEDGEIYAVPSGMKAFSDQASVWDPAVGAFVTASARTARGQSFSPPVPASRPPGAPRSPARAARRAGRLGESADAELAAAQAAIADLGGDASTGLIVWRGSKDGVIRAAGFGPQGAYLDWDSAAGRWRNGMNLTPVGEFTEPLPARRSGVAARGRVAAEGPFTSVHGDTYGYDELLELFIDFVHDVDGGEGLDAGYIKELISTYLENEGLTRRVSKQWRDAAYARAMSIAGEVEDF
jgi:hypothetical protein